MIGRGDGPGMLLFLVLGRTQRKKVYTTNIVHAKITDL